MGVNSYTNKRLCKNIGITYVFSGINICRVPRELFEHGADRPSVQTSSEGPGKNACNETTCVIVIPCIFYLFNRICTENAVKTLNCPFSYTEQNGDGCKLSNVITSSQRHNRTSRTIASAK